VSVRITPALPQLINLPPVKSHLHMTLVRLVDYKGVSTDQLKQLARLLPGGSRVHLPHRITAIAFLLGTRQIELH